MYYYMSYASKARLPETELSTVIQQMSLAFKYLVELSEYLNSVPNTTINTTNGDGMDSAKVPL